MTEKEIIEGCRKNNNAAQELLYRMHFGTMYGYVLQFIKDKETSIDIVNNAFLKVFTKIDKYVYDGTMEGWIRVFVKRAMYDHLRANKLYNSRLSFEEYEGGLAENVNTDLYHEDLLKLVAKLPPATQNVFKMYALEGYSHAEIAKAANISEGTSKWHLNNARTELKKLIEKNGYTR